MSKRRMLYGYYIQQGEIAIVETEAIIVRRVFSLCIGGLSYQKISDLLNAEKIPYSQEMPVWNKHKVKRLLENPLLPPLENPPECPPERPPPERPPPLPICFPPYMIELIG